MFMSIRYLDKADARRTKTTAHIMNKDERMQFTTDEHRGPPKERTYAAFFRDGRASAALNGAPVNGCKGVWEFDRLPYAEFICSMKDWMHTTKNTVVRSTCAMSFQKERNRTMGSLCREDCKAEGIHKHLWKPLPSEDTTSVKYARPKWSLSKKESRNVTPSYST
jgi:hypothetical protein